MGTVIVSAALFVLLVLAVRSIYRDKKSGGGCGCSKCSGCSGGCSYQSQSQNQK